MDRRVLPRVIGEAHIGFQFHDFDFRIDGFEYRIDDFDFGIGGIEFRIDDFEF